MMNKETNENITYVGGNQQLNAIYFALKGEFPDMDLPEKKLLDEILG